MINFALLKPRHYNGRKDSTHIYASAGYILLWNVRNSKTLGMGQFPNCILAKVVKWEDRELGKKLS